MALGVGVGASLGTNTIADKVTAYADNSTLKAASNIMATAASTSMISSTTAGGSGAGGFALGGSVSLNTLTNTIDAHITSNSQVTAGGAVTISSSDTPSLKTLAGGVAFSGAVAIGAAFSTNKDMDNITAYIDGSTVKANGGNVTINATSTSTFNGQCLGVGVSTMFSGSGSVANVTLAGTVDAHISGGATVSAQNSILDQAQSTDNITSLALAASAGLYAAGGSQPGHANPQHQRLCHERLFAVRVYHQYQQRKRHPTIGQHNRGRGRRWVCGSECGRRHVHLHQ